MQVIDPGHRYTLHGKDGELQTLHFFKDNEIHDTGHDGVLCQELLRVLLHRVEYLEDEVPAPENKIIHEALITAFIAFETRALRRKLEKCNPATIPPGDDGYLFTVNYE